MVTLYLCCSTKLGQMTSSKSGASQNTQLLCIWLWLMMALCSMHCSMTRWVLLVSAFTCKSRTHANTWIHVKHVAHTSQMRTVFPTFRYHTATVPWWWELYATKMLEKHTHFASVCETSDMSEIPSHSGIFNIHPCMHTYIRTYIHIDTRVYVHTSVN